MPSISPPITGISLYVWGRFRWLRFSFAFDFARSGKVEIVALLKRQSDTAFQQRIRWINLIKSDLQIEHNPNIPQQTTLAAETFKKTIKRASQSLDNDQVQLCKDRIPENCICQDDNNTRC